VTRCERSLAEHAGPCDDPEHRMALARRASSGVDPWSRLVPRRDDFGYRDLLDGDPVHCGDILLLQQQIIGADDFGTWIYLLDAGSLVRYERNSLSGVVTLYASVCGYSFSYPHVPTMTFRWPHGGRREP
jgi:hypothetical protein